MQLSGTILNSLMIVYHMDIPYFYKYSLIWIFFLFLFKGLMLVSISVQESLPEITILWPFPENHRGWFSGLAEEAQ